MYYKKQGYTQIQFKNSGLFSSGKSKHFVYIRFVKSAMSGNRTRIKKIVGNEKRIFVGSMR